MRDPHKSPLCNMAAEAAMYTLYLVEVVVEASKLDPTNLRGPHRVDHAGVTHVADGLARDRRVNHRVVSDVNTDVPAPDDKVTRLRIANGNAASDAHLPTGRARQ